MALTEINSKSIKDGEIVYSHSGKLTYDQLSAQIEKYK